MKILPKENNGRFGCSFTVKYRELTGFLNQIPLKLISFVIASAIMLSACGGGGGGGGGSSKTTVSTPFGSVAGKSNSAAAQGKIAAAAIAVPAAGSVTQSSNTLDGITTDRVSTSVEYNDNGQLIYRVQNGIEWDVDSAASDTRTLNKGRYTDWNFAELYKKLEDGRLWVDVYSDIGRTTTSQEAITATGCGIRDTVLAGKTCRYEGGGNDFTFTVGADGRACVASSICSPSSITINDFMATGDNGVWTIDSLPTDAMPVAGGTQTHSMPDTDYLAGGIWVYVPDDAMNVNQFEFGAFVDGADPYTGGIVALTGQYTYTGGALECIPYWPMNVIISLTPMLHS